MQTLCLKYRLFPSKEQARKLEDTLETCRLVYNSLANDRVFQYETAKVSVSRYEQQKRFPQWSKDLPEVRAVHSQVLQNVAVRVDLAFRAFFQRVKRGKTPGFPRLKGEGQCDSITYPQSGFKVGESSVWLSLQGKQTQVKAKLHRAAVGMVKTCTVRRYGSKWFVCFSVEQKDASLPPCMDAIGLDAGLNSFLALSNGEFIDNPRLFRRDEKALAKAGRKQAKTKKRSPERKKANKVLSRIHGRIRNRRHDFVHQTARRLVNRYGVIAIEKLNVRGMMQNHCLAKSIGDASWSMFRTVLTQKAESAAREVTAVNPTYTSQDCSVCGYRPDGLEGSPKKRLSDRWHHCPMCTASLDRDTNAAINILNLARGTSHIGITMCQVTPIEAPALAMGSNHSYLYNKVVFDLLVGERGEGEAVLFVRSATAGGQQFPVHWGGDCASEFESVAESLRGGLSLCLSGFGFWSHDIGGFEGTPPAAVYKRWVAFGLLSPHSRLHGSSSYRVPWVYDDEAVDVLRFFTKLKCRLMPYLFAAAREAHETGAPMMRAMLLKFPSDPACDFLDRQYMLGPSLLVAPVFSEDRVSYYVPEGLWTDFLTGRVITGSKWVEETHGFLSVPLLVRPGSVITVGDTDDRPDYDYATGVTFQLYELSDGEDSAAVVPTMAGEEALALQVRRSGRKLTADVGGAGEWRLLLVGIPNVEAVEGGTAEETERGILIRPTAGSGSLVVTLND